MSMKYRISSEVATMSLRRKVREEANFTPLQAQIFEELASEERNNEGIILQLHLSPDRYYAEKKIVVAMVQAVLEEIRRA